MANSLQKTILELHIKNLKVIKSTILKYIQSLQTRSSCNPVITASGWFSTSHLVESELKRDSSALIAKTWWSAALYLPMVNTSLLLPRMASLAFGTQASNNHSRQHLMNANS
jgi:hypothetical protein